MNFLIKNQVQGYNIPHFKGLDMRYLYETRIAKKVITKSQWQFLFGLNKRALDVKYVKGLGYIGISTSISRIVKLTFYRESI